VGGIFPVDAGLPRPLETGGQRRPSFSLLGLPCACVPLSSPLVDHSVVLRHGSNHRPSRGLPQTRWRSSWPVELAAGSSGCRGRMGGAAPGRSSRRWSSWSADLAAPRWVDVEAGRRRSSRGRGGRGRRRFKEAEGRKINLVSLARFLM
jgi:hypothetical protein